MILCLMGCRDPKFVKGENWMVLHPLSQTQPTLQEGLRGGGRGGWILHQDTLVN